MTYKEVKNMVQGWIVNNKRPMTADDAIKLAGNDTHVLNDIYTAACTFAHAPTEARFRAHNNFDVKFMVRYVELRHGPQMCVYQIP